MIVIYGRLVVVSYLLVDRLYVMLFECYFISFACTCSRLFTKIGMETFPQMSSLLLWEFKCLLSHQPCPVGQQRLLQLMAINMFALEQQQQQQQQQLQQLQQQQAALTQSATSVDNSRPGTPSNQLRDLALQLGFNMFSLLVEVRF